MKLYWKVHIKNYDSFMGYIIKLYENFSNENLYYTRSSYRGEDYIYLLVKYEDNGTYRLSFTSYSDGSRIWLESNHWIYQGEYNSRKEKLERLEVVSGCSRL
jgi:hypothetical protein